MRRQRHGKVHNIFRRRAPFYREPELFAGKPRFSGESNTNKGIYPYEYMDSWEQFSEMALPAKDKFYSKLNDECITNEEYAHTQRVWETFQCKNLGDYHDLYVKTDVALLADVFENFRTLCMEKYGLDPAHYFTSPGLSWDALLKMSGVELELLMDMEMHLFIGRGMRGRISITSKRYAKANNPFIDGYDPSQPKKYIIILTPTTFMDGR